MYLLIVLEFGKSKFKALAGLLVWQSWLLLQRQLFVAASFRRDKLCDFILQEV
jgi:hypothetical protein